MEKGLNEIDTHLRDWKIKLNTSKIESILFTKSTIMQRKAKETKIKFDVASLEWLPTVKNLGVVLDSRLLMNQNITNNITKARKATVVLYPLL
jgi:hypothetical protein